MKRKVAIGAAKWLSKRKNRDKVKRMYHKLRARMEQDQRLDETDTGGARHESGENGGDRPASGDRGRSRR